MHKQLVCLVGAVLLALPDNARANDDDTWSERSEIGIHLGLDFAGIGGSELDDTGIDYSYRTGLTGGGIVAMRLTHMIAVQLEIDFVTKGYRADTDSPSTSGTRYMGYLEMPLLARITMPVSASLQPYLNLGPTFGMLLGAGTTYDDGRHNDVSDRIDALDVGLMFGVGAAMNVGRMGAITLDIRYNLGLRNWGKDATSDSEAFNRAIYLTAGYRADLATLGRLFGGEPR